MRPAPFFDWFTSASSGRAAPRAANNKRERPRTTRFFMVPVTESDIPALRDIMGRTLGYADTRHGNWNATKVVDVKLYDPSGGYKYGQMFAVITVNGFVPQSVFEGYFPDPKSIPMQCKKMDALSYRMFSEVKL